MGDLTVIILSIGLVMICWVCIKINDKVDRHIKRFRKFEQALLKNSTGKIPTVENKETSGKIDVPMAATSMDLKKTGHQYIAKK